MKIFPAFVATALLAALIYGANFGWWLDRSVMDSDSFVESTEEALGEEISRIAVSALIVDEMIGEFPLLIIVESNLVAMFSDLLATDAFAEVAAVVAADVHERIVTGDQSAIAINLVAYRDLVLAPLEAIAQSVAELVPDEWFVSVEILEAGALPDLSAYVDWTAVVRVLAALGAIALAAGMLWYSRRTSVAVLLIGAAFASAGLATAVLVPGARWLTLNGIDRVSVRVVIGNTYDAFTDHLLWSAGIMLVLGLGLMALGAAMRTGGEATEPAG